MLDDGLFCLVNYINYRYLWSNLEPHSSSKYNVGIMTNLPSLMHCPLYNLIIEGGKKKARRPVSENLRVAIAPALVVCSRGDFLIGQMLEEGVGWLG